jgi:tRNA (mo5U34)-methyltransferase
MARAERIEKHIADLAPWFQNLRLPTGYQAAPDRADAPRLEWQELGMVLPADLTGWRALEVGGNAGFYTFELARRGANVVGIETDARDLAQARWAALELERHVRFERMHVYELAHRKERFDLVLFLGGMNHLRDPLLALDILAGKAKQLFVLQTPTVPGEDLVHAPVDLLTGESESMLQLGWPKLAFVERRFPGDSTNWWTPNHACVVAMLRSAGLDVLVRLGDELDVCTPFPATDAMRRELDAPTRC